MARVFLLLGQSRSTVRLLPPQRRFFVDHGWCEQVVDDDVEVAVVVEVGHGHAAAAFGGVEAPGGDRLKVALAVVAVGEVFFNQFGAGQMSEHIDSGHAVYDVEVDEAIVIEVAKLGGPAPAAGLEAAGDGFIGVAKCIEREPAGHFR